MDLGLGISATSVGTGRRTTRPSTTTCTDTSLSGTSARIVATEGRPSK